MNSGAGHCDGKRIVITRAVEQSRDLKERLENLGATVLLLPAVSFSEPADTTRSWIARSVPLESFDWILFTSANAVRFFAARCRKLGVEPGEKRSPAAPQSARPRPAPRLPKDLQSNMWRRNFLGRRWPAKLAHSLAGKKILLPRSDRARARFARSAEGCGRGSHGSRGVSYGRGWRGRAGGAATRCAKARVDVVSFFSPSAVENLRGELGAEVLSRLGATRGDGRGGSGDGRGAAKCGLAGGDRGAGGDCGIDGRGDRAIFFIANVVSQARSS